MKTPLSGLRLCRFVDAADAGTVAAAAIGSTVTVAVVASD